MTDWSRFTRPQRKLMADLEAAARRTVPTGERCDLPCPVCGTPLRLRISVFGRYYKCPQKGCKGARSAKLDGTPCSSRKPITWYDKLGTLEIDESC
jgi:hypothetical protein